MTEKIVFIGAGNMAEAIVAGLLHEKLFQANEIYMINRANIKRLEYVRDTYNVRISQQLENTLTGATKIVLAVKPKDILETLQSIKPYIHANQLLISVIAGVATDSMEQILEVKVPIVRAMPNTSAAIGKSATAICGGSYANEEQIKESAKLFETIGTVEIVEEYDLHAVTGLSGSGPAYIYFLVEAMEKAASELRLNEETAKNLIAQTIIGAGEMLKSSPKDPATLRKNVTSPGGTTEAGLNVLMEKEVQQAIFQCIKQAAARSVEMGKELKHALDKEKML